MWVTFSAPAFEHTRISIMLPVWDRVYAGVGIIGAYECGLADRRNRISGIFLPPARAS